MVLSIHIKNYYVEMFAVMSLWLLQVYKCNNQLCSQSHHVNSKISHHTNCTVIIFFIKCHNNHWFYIYIYIYNIRWPMNLLVPVVTINHIDIDAPVYEEDSDSHIISRIWIVKKRNSVQLYKPKNTIQLQIGLEIVLFS